MAATVQLDCESEKNKTPNSCQILNSFTGSLSTKVAITRSLKFPQTLNVLHLSIFGRDMVKSLVSLSVIRDVYITGVHC